MNVDIANYKKGSSLRTQNLLKMLMEKGFSDRSGEWFKESMFPPVDNENLSIIERRAISFRIMLESMVSPENSRTAHTYEIKPGELIVGNIAMGSVGLGKVYPQYMTDEEQRLISVTNRDMQSTFGHNIPDFQRVLKKGLKWIIEYCNKKIEESKYCIACDSKRKNKKIEFFNSVIICCKAVISYANAYAKLAEEYAKNEKNPIRKKELIEIARICKKVPAEKADTFYEAIQSVYFVHLALHSTLDYTSLGRLDQLLEPYLQKDLKNGAITDETALELYECLFVKCAERININPAYFLKQDHSSFGGVFGDNPVFLDQIASANNFLQNIAIGGLTRDGNDASNRSTILILKACANLGLPTPVVDIRLHKNTPKEVLKEIVLSLKQGKNGMPVIFNDNTIVEGLKKNNIPIEECYDYAVDGCWEPILNAKCDWIFGMINFLTILECSLNSGCTFSADPCVLRGAKVSYITKSADQIHSFNELIENVKIHTQFYLDKTMLTAYTFYSVEGSLTPTPFFSSLLGGCLEYGMDKTWGGSDFHITGALGVALPNCANALANIKKYVFDEKKYSLSQVVDALKKNFQGYEEMKNIFLNDNNKYGNNSHDVDNIMKQLLDCFHEVSIKSKKLGDDTFLYKSKEYSERIISNRAICHYEGPSMHEKYGERFNMIFNIGCGTFGQYSFMGKSVGASADGRSKGEPLASNLSPVTGTMKNGLANALASIENLELNRFPAGAVVDFCIDDTSEERDTEYYEIFLKEFVNKNGNIMSITFVDANELNNVFKICEDVRNGKLSPEELHPYAHISVRVGGFNAPFITIPREQQLNYLNRITK